MIERFLKFNTIGKLVVLALIALAVVLMTGCDNNKYEYEIVGFSDNNFHEYVEQFDKETCTLKHTQYLHADMDGDGKVDRYLQSSSTKFCEIILEDSKQIEYRFSSYSKIIYDKETEVYSDH